jgi:hypothetical protein
LQVAELRGLRFGLKFKRFNNFNQGQFQFWQGKTVLSFILVEPNRTFSEGRVNSNPAFTLRIISVRLV